MGEEAVAGGEAEVALEHEAIGSGAGVAERMVEKVREGGLLTRQRPVVTMLSGGRDSVCLLDLAVRICEQGAVTALHVNYGLREEASEDERHCAALCERLGVRLEVLDASADGGAPARGNLQAWAREVRYGAAQRIADRLDATIGRERLDATIGRERLDAAIAVGHTASDQVETILYRLLASPGRRALLGMSESEGRIVRPLLRLTREQTAEYCNARDLPWREDESNLSDRYARNRVRHRLLPALRAVHPAAEGNVLRTAELLREETELLDGLIDDELAGRDSIEIERLAALPSALARLVVVRLAERAAGVLVPQAGERVAEIVQLGRRGGSAQLHVGGLAGAVIEGGRLRMAKLPPRSEQARGGGRAELAES
jgi:tRNA(Ile)-lysidine synthase